MKKETLKKYFNKIMEETSGVCNNDSEIIDYSNGNSISIDEIEEEYYNYLNLQDEIDNYIENENLDDVFDEKKIKNYFSNKISDEYFRFNQAVLRNFIDYMSTKINNQNSKIRKVNVIFNKNGNGYLTTKINVPVPWIKELGFTERSKTGMLFLEEGKIILKKELKNEN